MICAIFLQNAFVHSSVRVSQWFTPKKQRSERSPGQQTYFLSESSGSYNAVLIGFIAKGLVYLIDGITNICFYGKFSFAPASPARIIWVGLLFLFRSPEVC